MSTTAASGRATRPRMAHATVSAMTVDTHGHKWFATLSGVSELDDQGTLDKSDDVWTTFPFGGIQTNADQSGKVWIGIRDLRTYEAQGLTVWDGTSWKVYDTSNSGLPYNRIGDILVDDQDVKWFATYGGLTKLVEHPYQVFMPAVGVGR